MNIEQIAELTHAVCKKYGWDRDWKQAGVQLFLESSEFIEALRGKEGNVIEEAGDVLFVLLSMLEAHSILIEDVLESIIIKSRGLLDNDKSYNNYGRKE